jgi:hypothetical protein
MLYCLSILNLHISIQEILILKFSVNMIYCIALHLVKTYPLQHSAFEDGNCQGSRLWMSVSDTNESQLIFARGMPWMALGTKLLVSVCQSTDHH